MTWRARVNDEFPMNGARIHLADIYGDRGQYVVSIGPGLNTEMRTVEGPVTGPEGMFLPTDALEPLRNALDEYLGKPRDDYRSKYEEARDALEVERRRVDALLMQSAVSPTS